MLRKNDSDLFYTCGLVEHIGRTRTLRRADVANQLGEANLRRIYRFADVLHCDNIDRVAEEYCRLSGIREGNYDNVGACNYEVPERWAIAGVYARLTEDVAPADCEDPIPVLLEVYRSWVSDAISDYNTDFFYQPRSYIAACYKEGEVLE